MKTEPLTNYLSTLDKKRIKNYILKYGGIASRDTLKCIEEDPQYVDNWLANWSKDKKKLYRLFGNSFIIQKRITIKNDSDYLWEEYKKLLRDLCNLHKADNEKNAINGKEIGEHDFWSYLKSYNFVREALSMKIYKKSKDGNKDYLFIPLEEFNEASFFNRVPVLNRMDKICYNFFRFGETFENAEPREEEIRVRRDLPDGKYKELRITKTEKIEKVQRKILDFFDFKQNHPDFYQQYTIFAKKVAELKSQGSHEAILCLSIHPLDFMSMSDNCSNWSSCMNWTEDYEGGCYRIGSVEMMNSNVVVCAYLLSTNEKKQVWNFGTYPSDWGKEDYYYPNCEGEEWEWNNKTWRCLYYVTKDLLVSGKSYPYYNENLNFQVLEILKDMVKEKFNWEYEYGIQPYLDMKRCSYSSFYNARQLNGNVMNKKTKKKSRKILIETRGMYNDFLLNKSFKGYYCYRNRVNKLKIISVSGVPLSIYDTEPFQLNYDGYLCSDEGEYEDRYGECDRLF